METAAFQGSGIEAFEVAEGNPYLSAVDGVLFTADKKTLLAYPTGNKQKIYFIPDGTENIGKSGLYVFDMCPNIEEVYIPSSVKTFDTIMWCCENLKKVVYAKDSKISTVSGSCFQETGLESICLPASINKFSSAGDDFFDSFGNEFLDCHNLRTMYVAKAAGLYNCEYFGSQTLSGCDNLTIYGEGMDNAVSALADKFYRPYIDVSSGCDRVLGITFDDTCVSIEEGESVQQKAFIYPESTENKTVTYESSDPSIATVDENGNIRGIALGVCYITATATDGSGEYARCKVTVRNTYTVTFKNGTKESKVTVAEGEKVEKPVNPKREGYRFDGWFAIGATKAFDFKTAINGNIMLTARWVKLTSISAVTVKVAKAEYTGKIQKPKVTVTYKGKKLTINKDYKLNYGSYKKVGKAQVKIIGINNYMGIKVISYDITPKKNEITSLANVSGKKLIVRFGKATGAKKYEIFYSTNKNFKDAKKVPTTKSNVTLKNLKKGKLYYVKVRSCVNVGKKTIYSDYSKVMKKKIMK